MPSLVRGHSSACQLSPRPGGKAGGRSDAPVHRVDLRLSGPPEQPPENCLGPRPRSASRPSCRAACAPVAAIRNSSGSGCALSLEGEDCLPGLTAPRPASPRDRSHQLVRIGRLPNVGLASPGCRRQPATQAFRSRRAEHALLGLRTRAMVGGDDPGLRLCRAARASPRH
jgi:hypothetical protein